MVALQGEHGRGGAAREIKEQVGSSFMHAVRKKKKGGEGERHRN